MKTLSPKQLVYRQMFSLTLVYLRALASQPWWRGLLDRSTHYEADLLHNLPISMFDDDFVEHDIWFLNVQARYYYTHCSRHRSSLYDQQVALIAALFRLLPDEMRAGLHWNGPVSTLGAARGL